MRLLAESQGAGGGLVSSGVTHCCIQCKAQVAEGEGAQLGTSQQSASGDPLAPRAAGDREKPSLLWSLWRLSMWGWREGGRP